MPYIDLITRQQLAAGDTPMSPGELNYLLTMMCLEFLNTTQRKYSDYNTIVGALECVKQEFYRRAVVPYEDKKIKENGDVYE